MAKKKFKIIDMHCSSCAILIDDDLEDTDGVVSAKTHFAKSESEVEFDPSKISQERILEIIKQSGYTAIPLD